MAEAHHTAQPEQLKTDSYLVFDDVYSNANLELVARIEVPRYTQPSAEGVELDPLQRKLLAVARAVERGDTRISDGQGGNMSVEALVGCNFLVLDEVDGEMDEVPYEQNPAFDAVWNPEEEDA